LQEETGLDLRNGGERCRCLALEIEASFSNYFAGYNTFQDIHFEPYVDNSGKCFLLILLLDNSQSELFTVLCEDLIRSVQSFADTNDVLSSLILRIQQWQLLFDKLKSGELPLSAQIGLYGELYFLRRIINAIGQADSLVNCWVGPQSANQDFNFLNCAVEVKTTHGKNHQKIHIASERQLDTIENMPLFLYHLSVDNRNNSGETLNDCIDNLYSILSGNHVALSRLKHQLYTIGYFDVHRTFYDTIGYSIRQERAFKVVGSFPRITEAMLPSGVGDLRYSIIIPDETSWSIVVEDLITTIKV
jgi:hypothetical protein